jgi:hypothetical protein
VFAGKAALENGSSLPKEYVLRELSFTKDPRNYRVIIKLPVADAFVT